MQNLYLARWATWVALIVLLGSGLLPAQNTPVAQFDPGRIYLKLSDDTERTIPSLKALTYDEELTALRPLVQTYGLQAVRQPFAHLHTPTFDRTYEFRFDPQADVEGLIRDLEQLDWVEYAEPIPLRELHSIPNDSLWNQVAGHLQLIQADSAWELHTGGNTTVAIIDNALQTDHPDLAPNLWTNPGEIAGNGLDDDNNGYVDDVHGYDVSDGDGDVNPPASAGPFTFSHGTHCAGIAAGATNNQRGIASVGYDTQIIGVKATPDGGDDLFIPDAEEAFAYCIAVQPDVISASYGSPFPTQTEENLVAEAQRRGIMVVSSAGNFNASLPFYPAAFETVIAVANTTNDDLRSPSSSFGPWVDVSAPGTEILSTVSFDTYAPYTGTSMSGPMVGGLLALMKSYRPGYPISVYEYAMLESADPLDSLNPDYLGQLGSGRINAYQALQALDCYPLASNSDGPRLDTLRLGSLTAISTDSCVTYDFDRQAISFLSPSDSLDLQMSLGTCGPINPRQVAVFLDWNGDGDFADSLERVWESGFVAGNERLSQKVEVPAFTLEESVLRMRIIVREDTGRIEPCASYQVGETEDHLVSFIPELCPPGNLTLADYSYEQDFEAFTRCDTAPGVACVLAEGWSNANDDDLDWLVHRGSTPTVNTGPSGDYLPGDSLYLYVEAYGGAADQRAELLSPCLDFSGLEQPELSFAYHMFGLNMGTLLVQARTEGLWETVWTSTGNRQNLWRTATVDLSLFAGQQARLRFVGLTGDGERSDMALGFINIGEGKPCQAEQVLRDTAASLEDGSGRVRPYANATDCRWLIQPYNARHIRIDLESLRILPGQDSLRIHDGENEAVAALREYSGFLLGDSLEIEGGSTYLRFKTDSSGQNEGWRLRYRAELLSDVLSYQLDEQTGMVGDTLLVPLRVQDFTDMVQAEVLLTLSDPSVAQFAGTAELAAGLSGSLTATALAADTLQLIWAADPTAPLSLGAGANLAQVAVVLTGQAGDSVALRVPAAEPGGYEARRRIGEAENVSLLLFGGDTTTLFLTANTSVAEAGSEGELRVAPNPFGERLRVGYTLPAGQGGTLYVRDALGRVVWQQALAPEGGERHLQLDTQSWATGLYLLELRQAQTLWQRKVFKQ